MNTTLMYTNKIQNVLDIKMRNWVWLAAQIKMSKQMLSRIKSEGFPEKYRNRISDALEVPYYMIWKEE